MPAEKELICHDLHRLKNKQQGISLLEPLRSWLLQGNLLLLLKTSLDGEQHHAYNFLNPCHKGIITLKLGRKKIALTVLKKKSLQQQNQINLYIYNTLAAPSLKKQVND